MTILKTLYFAVTTALLTNFGFSNMVSITPIVPYINNLHFSLDELNPNFIIDMVEVNFNLLELSLNNPDNSFNKIIDPTLRLLFLENIVNSIDDITSALSLATNQLNLDNSIIDTIHSRLLTSYQQITDRITDFMLPLNVSSIAIKPDFYVERLSSNKINTIIDIYNNYAIKIPIILQNLNNSLYDLAVRIDNTNTYITQDILASYDLINIRLTDIDRIIVPATLDVVLRVNTDICSFVADCDLYCKVWNSNLNQWEQVPTVVYDLHQVLCSVPINTQSKLNDKMLTVSTSEFLPLGVFDIKSSQNSSISNSFIIFICIFAFIFVISLLYVVKRCYYRQKYGILNDYPVSNYQSV